MEAYIVHAGVEPGPVHRIGDPLVRTLVEQKGVQRRHIVVRRQLVQLGKPHADEGPQRLADRGDVCQDCFVCQAIFFVKFPLRLQGPRLDQQGPGLFQRLRRDEREALPCGPFPTVLFRAVQISAMESRMSLSRSPSTKSSSGNREYCSVSVRAS